VERCCGRCGQAEKLESDGSLVDQHSNGVSFGPRRNRHARLVPRRGKTGVRSRTLRAVATCDEHSSDPAIIVRASAINHGRISRVASWWLSLLDAAGDQPGAAVRERNRRDPVRAGADRRGETVPIERLEYNREVIRA